MIESESSFSNLKSWLKLVCTNQSDDRTSIWKNVFLGVKRRTIMTNVINDLETKYSTACQNYKSMKSRKSFNRNSEFRVVHGSCRAKAPCRRVPKLNTSKHNMSTSPACASICVATMPPEFLCNYGPTNHHFLYFFWTFIPMYCLHFNACLGEFIEDECGQFNQFMSPLSCYSSLFSIFLKTNNSETFCRFHIRSFLHLVLNGWRFEINLLSFVFTFSAFDFMLISMHFP